MVYGSVTPVTGIRPTTTLKLSIAWNAIQNVIPNETALPNMSLHLLDIINPLYIITKNNTPISKDPKKPNSSQIMANMKSVCGSGK